MAQAWCTGPAYLFCQPPAQSVQFLGNTERTPKMRVVREFEPVMNDMAGTKVPYDRLFQGKHIFISGLLTRFNWSVYLALAQLPNVTGDGLDIPGDVGTLMMTEGKAVPFWVEFPYAVGGRAGKAAMAGMPQGYHLFAGVFEGPDEHEAGTGPNKIGFNMHGLRVPVVSTISGASGLVLSCFDHDMTASLAIPIN